MVLVKKVKKVVLAYSGGLDTSIMIPWLKENYGCEVVAYCADLGQREELAGLKAKAKKSGASKVIVEDLRKTFVEDYLWPMVKSGAIYEGEYLLGTSIARPLIAKRQAEVALKEGADALAHGATGKGNDQVRFELTYMAIAPKLKVIAPWREWKLKSRTEEIDYAKKRGIPIPVTKSKPYSSDRNLWHISYEGGILEDPDREPSEDMFILTTAPEKAPNKPEYVEIGFSVGVPVTVNGKKMDSVALVEKLNVVAGRHGVGRVDIVENRLVGMKSRGVYETPAGTLIFAAHRALESLTLDRATAQRKRMVADLYADIVYNGQWFGALRKHLDAFVNSTQKKVTGTVRLKLFKGSCRVVGRKSPHSLYDPNLATFEEGRGYSQKDAEGFIRLFGLPFRSSTIPTRR